MKLYEKIKLLLKEKGWTLMDLQRSIEDLFETDPIQYRTLLRTVHGETKIRQSSLFQIACALGTTPKAIKEGTEDEEEFIYIRYNKKAYWEIDKDDNEFAQGRLVLLPGAKTERLKDAVEIADFMKCLYVLHGEITCVVETEDRIKNFTIKKHKCYFFKSTDFHYFENKTDKKAVAILTQNPKPKHLY